DAAGQRRELWRQPPKVPAHRVGEPGLLRLNGGQAVLRDVPRLDPDRKRAGETAFTRGRGWQLPRDDCHPAWHISGAVARVGLHPVSGGLVSDPSNDPLGRRAQPLEVELQFWAWDEVVDQQRHILRLAEALFDGVRRAEEVLRHALQ